VPAHKASLSENASCGLTTVRGSASRVVLLGRQGAGKGTQAERLAAHFDVPRISTGDMFRAGADTGADLNGDLSRSMKAGELMPDVVVVEMVRARLSHTDAIETGFVMEGFPRNVAQAEALDSMLAPDGLDVAVELVVPSDLVRMRLASRRVCVDCGANYSVAQPPRSGWTCDVCGGQVVSRQDDNQAAIDRRLALYEEQSAPLIEWYRRTGRLAAVDGTGNPDTVSQNLLATVTDHHARAQPNVGGLNQGGKS